MLFGLLSIFTVREPPRNDRIEVSIEEDAKDEDKVELLRSVTQQIKEDENVRETEIEIKKDHIVINKKRKGCKTLCVEYGRALKMLFSNCAAVMVIIGCMFRLIETAAISIQQDNFSSVYIKIYRDPNSNHYGQKFDDHYQDLYAGIMGVASFVCALLANLMSGVIISKFE